MPDKSHFICKNCIYYDVGFCKIYPTPTRKSAPSTEFCGQGKWMIWNELFKEMCPYYWGEWDRTGRNDHLDPKEMMGVKLGRPSPQEIYDAEETAKREGT